MKKSMVWLSVVALLGSVGGGFVGMSDIAPTVTAQAAALNPAKLADGQYQLGYTIYQTGTTTKSGAMQYLKQPAVVTAKNHRASLTLTVTALGNPYIKAITVGGKTATVTKAVNGNTYRFSQVDLTKQHKINFVLAIPVNGQTTTVQETSTLVLKTNTLKAVKVTKKVALKPKQVKAKAKKVSGTTTKGAKVTVKHGQTTLGQATTKKAAYTVKLKKAVKKNWKLKVTAKKAGYKSVTKTVTVK